MSVAEQTEKSVVDVKDSTESGTVRSNEAQYLTDTISAKMEWVKLPFISIFFSKLHAALDFRVTVSSSI